MRSKVLVHIGVVVTLGVSAGCTGRGDATVHSLDEARLRCSEAEMYLSEQRVPEAMFAADEAASAAEADDSVKCVAYKVMSLCHSAAHNSASALSFAEMALECVPDDEDAQGLYADALAETRHYRESVDYLDNIAPLLSPLSRRKLPALLGLEEWERVVALTDSIGFDQLADTELLYRAYALARLGRLSTLSPELEVFSDCGEVGGLTREELRLLADIYAANGDGLRAEVMERRLAFVQDSLIASLAESKIYEDLYSLEHSRPRQEQMKARRSELRLILAVGIGVMLALVLGVVILMMRLRSTHRRAEAERHLLMLNDELKRRHEENRAQESSLAEMSSRVDRLFRDHYEAIEMAANLLLDASLSKNSEKKIADSLSGIVDGCREPKFLRSLEQTINAYRGNVIERLRTQLPDLSDGDMTIILYSAGGLTPRVMCLLTGLSASALYNRKYRLKKRISASAAPDAKEFIQLLEQ